MSATLELRDLHKRYGDTVALDGASFSVGEGEMFGFVGPNGAGKTTLMRIVLGVLAADTGEVLWRGEAIGEEERRRIGYMRAGEAAERWIERLGLGRRADEAVEALSLGNQQRVQLALALVHEPDLLVLDEPFSGLDPDGVDALSGALRSEIEARRVPVIFSSHQLELVERLCDSVAIIREGRIVASGAVGDFGGSLVDAFREATRR